MLICCIATRHPALARRLSGSQIGSVVHFCTNFQPADIISLVPHDRSTCRLFQAKTRPEKTSGRSRQSLSRPMPRNRKSREACLSCAPRVPQQPQAPVLASPLSAHFLCGPQGRWSVHLSRGPCCGPKGRPTGSRANRSAPRPVYTAAARRAARSPPHRSVPTSWPSCYDGLDQALAWAQKTPSTTHARVRRSGGAPAPRTRGECASVLYWAFSEPKQGPGRGRHSPAGTKTKKGAWRRNFPRLISRKKAGCGRGCGMTDIAKTAGDSSRPRRDCVILLGLLGAPLPTFRICGTPTTLRVTQ